MVVILHTKNRMILIIEASWLLLIIIMIINGQIIEKLVVGSKMSDILSVLRCFFSCIGG